MLISTARGTVNPDGGAAAACLFAVSPVQALTSSHPFLTSLYMFLILPRVNVHVMVDPFQASCILMRRAALSSKQRSSLLSLPSAESQRQLIEWSRRLRSPERRSLWPPFVWNSRDAHVDVCCCTSAATHINMWIRNRIRNVNLCMSSTNIRVSSTRFHVGFSSELSSLPDGLDTQAGGAERLRVIKGEAASQGEERRSGST